MSNSTARRGRKRNDPEHPSQSTRVRALERGLTLLEALAKVPELSLSELSRRAGLAPSTGYRLLETLRQRGYVVLAAENGCYRLGIRAFEVGAGFLATGQLHEVAQRPMRDLVLAVNETVNLAVQDGSEAIYIAQVEGQQRVRMFTQLGARAPLHCSGVGKVLLAWQEESEVRARLESAPLTAFTPHTLTNPKAVLAQLREIRQDGYAFDLEEFESGVRCVAAPVRDPRGTVVAALSLSAPSARLSDGALPELADKLRRCGQEISARLGWLE